MGEWKRLFYYLLLNVLVSAITTIAVLLFWEKSLLSNLNLDQYFANTDTPQTSIPLPPLKTPSSSSFLTMTPRKDISTQDKTPNADSLLPTETVELSPTPSPPPVVQITQGSQVTIDSIIGAGDLVQEKILIKRIAGSEDLSLANWSIKGENGLAYNFPQLILHKDGAVSVNTTQGSDTPIDLYWGRNEPAWISGSVISILNDQGVIQATYHVP